MKNNRFAFLDHLRAIAVLLVAFGHLVSVGTFAPKIPAVLPLDSNLPILDSNGHQLWKLGGLFVKYTGAQVAIVGVLLFFIITGYLMPKMFERYTRTEFIMNRFIRIGLPLVFGVLICGLVASLAGVNYTWENYVASITLSYKFVGIAPVSGVLWTLFIETVFYILLFLTNGIDKKKLLTYLVILNTIFLFAILQQQIDSLHYLRTITHTIAFTNAILVGVALHFVEKEKSLDSFILLVASICLYLIAMNAYNSVYETTVTYHKPGAIFTALIIALFFYVFSLKQLISPKFAKYTGLDIYARCCYSFYLVHVHVGLFAMYVAKEYISNSYILLLVGFSFSTLIAELLRFTVEDRSIKLARQSRHYVNLLAKPVS